MRFRVIAIIAENEKFCKQRGKVLAFPLLAPRGGAVTDVYDFISNKLNLFKKIFINTVNKMYKLSLT